MKKGLFPGVAVLLGAAATLCSAQTPHPGLGPYRADLGYTLGNELAIVITKADDGQQYFVDPRSDWFTTATEIHLKGKKGATYSTQEIVDGDTAFTILKTGSSFVVWERDASQQAPGIQILTGEAIMTPAQSQPERCGGCITSLGSSWDEEAGRCTNYCPTCSCTLCNSGPCPDPEPPEPEDPCLEFYELWEECMQDNYFEEDTWGPVHLEARP